MNTEMAHETIAQLAIVKAGDLDWDTLVVEKEIFEKMSKSTHWVLIGEKKLQGSGSPSLELRSLESDATLFLRDNILESTNERIWGFVFKLNKDGKFNIEYNYNKPEGL